MYTNTPTHPHSGSASAFPLISPLPTLAKTALICLSAIALIAVTPRTANAANILFFSDYNDPAVGFFPSGPGFTDSGWDLLLQNAGHNVIRFNPNNSQSVLLTAAEIAAINTNDLIIISRAVNSGVFQAGQGSQWNTNITKPLIDFSSYHVRTASSRMGWLAGDVSDNFDDSPTALHAVITGNPANDAAVDYLFGGVAMMGTNTVLPYDEPMDRNTSQFAGAPVAGGIVYATANYVQQNNTANPPTMNFGNVIVGLPAGTAVRSGADILAGYRMFFALGSRESATAPNAIPLYTGRENLTPTGERIFLRAVQLAINNGVPPATDPSAPIVITTQPASATVRRGESVTFTVAVSGAAPRTLQWQRDTGDGVTFTNIPDAATTFSGSSITLSNLTAADDNAHFRVAASNPNNNVTSDVATLTIAPDTTAPVPVSAVSLDGSIILVQFNELVDPRGLADGGQTLEPFNYTLTDTLGAGIATVVLQPDGQSVILTPNGPISPAFSLNIALISDLAGNAIDPAGVDVAGVNLGLSALDVGAVSPAGSSLAVDANTIQVVAGGLDVAGAADTLRLVYKTVDGDFDARVRVKSLVGVPDHLESTAKALLVARQDTTPGAGNIAVYTTPLAPADNSVGVSVRTNAAGATGTLSTFSPAGLPNGWMRIKRAGNLFTTYRSADGAAWTQMGSITLAYGPSMTVGLGASSHRTGRSVTATFSNFQILPGSPTIVSSSYVGGTFTASFQTQNSFSYRVEYKDDLNAATWTMLTTIAGDGTVKSFTDPGPAGTQRFYRIQVQ